MRGWRKTPQAVGARERLLPTKGIFYILLMRTISTKAVKDGMILAEPLKNAHGGLLLDKGTSLSAAFAARLALRGIASVRIEGDEGEEEEVVSSVHVSDAQNIPLEKLFENKMVNNSMKMIYNAISKYKESSAK